MAVGVRSSSSMWSSLRSISSRRRRISERRSSELMTSPQQEALAGGACPARALVGRAELNSALHSAVVGEVCCFLCFSHITLRPISVSRSDHARGLVRSRQRFVRWSQRRDKTAISAASLLADQQNKSSGSYQQGNQNTGDELNNPIPTGLDFFRSSAFLRRSETQPVALTMMSSRPAGVL